MNRHGDFIWYELLTGNIDAAAAFYGDVVGWQVLQGPDPIPGDSFSLVATDPQGARFGLVGPRP